MKLLFAIIFFFSFSIPSFCQPFVITWKSDFYGTIRIPGSGINYTISYVDIEDTSYHGTIQGYNSTDLNVSRISTYRISISGGSPAFNRIGFSSSSSRDKLSIMSIEQWGSIAWSGISFSGCRNLVDNATDVPDLSNVDSLLYMFEGCELFNTDISNWNTSAVTNMSYMFKDALSFNQPLANWNTTNVTDMGGMFQGAKAFNQPIGNWNIEHVTNMGIMFAYAYAFNQPIGNWNTANVIYMNQMFQSAINFNQPLDTWNTGKVYNMGGMFNQSGFNQPIGSWNTSHVIDMVSMFSNTPFNQPIGNWNTSNVTE